MKKQRLPSIMKDLAGGGGGKRTRGHAPHLSLLKLVIKKMATTCGALYFMFLASPSDNPRYDAAWSLLSGADPGFV